MGFVEDHWMVVGGAGRYEVDSPPPRPKLSVCLLPKGLCLMTHVPSEQ